MSNKAKVNKKLWGSFCGLMTGISWAVSAVCGEYIFTRWGVVSSWLVPVRMLTAGIVMMTFLLLTKRQETLKVVSNGRSLIQVLLTGILGIMMFQYTAFGAIQKSNAATALILQYLSPAMIMVYTCLRMKRKPSKIEVTAIVLAITGVFLIATHGNINSMVITTEALVWGLGCAFFMCLSTVLPENLYKKNPPIVVTGWSLISGGMVMTLLLRPWQYEVTLSWQVLVSLFFIILGGSVAAYLFYAIAVANIGSAKASLCACIEPVAATIMSVIWLKSKFMAIDLIGFALIMSTIFLLTKPEKKTCD